MLQQTLSPCRSTKHGPNRRAQRGRTDPSHCVTLSKCSDNGYDGLRRHRHYPGLVLPSLGGIPENAVTGNDDTNAICPFTHMLTEGKW